ncbi:MAG: hypothetical protein IH622_23130 [Ochrobactrum anthropi]|uniref:Uncharacterized protein n=1 Tax=Brucella anthropi TaxID=529 RepID=A0A8I0N828_BRUAN|nr:hypothetical protein [Brucella anthropi]MBE0563691.1 hypothetical protein [Brucella anthropi]
MFFKTCRRCNTSKPISCFALMKGKNSFKNKEQHHSYCKDCNNNYAREFRKKNPGYQGTGRIKSIPEEDRLLMSAIRQRITDAKARCKKLKRDNPNVSDEYLYHLFLSQERKCALTGVPLSLEKDHPHSLSLDQIDPGKGYVEGNVQWLSWYVNRAKGEMLTDVFVDMCEVVLNHRKVQRLSNGMAADAA